MEVTVLNKLPFDSIYAKPNLLFGKKLKIFFQLKYTTNLEKANLYFNNLIF